MKLTPCFARPAGLSRALVPALFLIAGCASTGPKDGPYEARYTREYKDSTPIEAVDSLLFAYREGDFDAVFYLTKPAESQTDAQRKAFLNEAEQSDDWTPALWEIAPDVAYTGDRTSADVLASVLSDLDGYLYSDTMRFYCFLDGSQWKIAQHDFEGDSMLLAPTETDRREK